MSSIGKKILSAFVEVAEKETVKAAPVVPAPAHTVDTTPGGAAESSKFKQHFEKLFRGADIPGPGYYQFSKMIEAMQSIPDERARYSAAFAGLCVQGLDKQKLLTTADGYIKLLEEDAASFSATVDAALEQKVNARQKEAEEKKARIQALSQEINELHKQVAVLQKEVAENEEKIRSNSSGYQREKEQLKTRVLQDIEKIRQHIQ